MPLLKTTSNPHGQTLKQLIQELGLIPDFLSANTAKIKYYLTISISREQQAQEVLEALECIVPKLLQPANFFLNDTQDVLNNLIEELVNLEKRLVQTKIINAEVNTALQSILTLYRDAQAVWKVATPEQQVMLKIPKAQIAMPWSVLDGDDFGFYYIDNQLALSLLSVDASGNTAKENTTGNRAVKYHKGVFYKRNPERDHIAPGAEFTIGSLLRLISGFALTPEIDLLVISNVTIQNDGKSQQIRGVVQASQGMGEMSLNDLLLKHGAEVLQRVDSSKFTPLIISLLMANPADGKGDNYRVVCTRDNNTHEILNWYPVPIDNDEGLGPAIGMVNSSLNNQQKHYVGMKDMAFFLKDAMDQQLDQNFIQKFINREPEIILLQFLSGLYAQDEQYARLKSLNRLTNEDLFVEGGEEALDIPIKLDPKLTELLLFKLKTIKKLIADNPLMTHRQLFEAMEPITAQAYQQIQLRVDQANLFVPEGEKIKEAYGFMHGGDSTTNNMPLTLRDLLATQINHSVTLRLPEFTGTKTIIEALTLYQDKERDIKRKRTQSLADVIQKFIQLIDFRTDSTTRLALLSLIGKYLPVVTKLPHLSQDELNQFFLEAVKNNDVDSVRALLQVGADVNYKDATNGNSALHVALLAAHISIELIGVLLAHPARKLNVANNKGDTPIFYIIDTKTLKRLVQVGENIEYKNLKDTLAPTLLDRAILHRNFYWFNVLVTEHYAGRNIDPKKALQFIQEGMVIEKNAGDWQKTLQVLRRENAEFARLSLLQTMTEQTPSGFEITGVSSGTLKINQTTVAQMFNADGTSKRSNTEYGCRAVAKIQSHGHTEAWAKFYPEMPGAQQIAECFSQALADVFITKNSLAPSELFAFVGPDRKTYALQVSRHVEGENLQRVVESTDLRNHFNETLDQQSFCQSFLLTLLLTPEDDKFDQFIVEKFVNKQGEDVCRIVAVEMDHNLVDTIVRKKDSTGKLHRNLQIKSAVYLLDAMLKPFDKELREKLTHLDPEEFLKACFTKLMAIHTQNVKIFDERQIKELAILATKDAESNNTRDGKGSIIGMFFTNEIVDVLLHKLQKIKESLLADSNITCLKLLSAVTPEVGIVVEAQFQLSPKDNHPLERFKNLYEQHYAEVADKKSLSKANSNSTTHLYSKQVSGKEHKVKVSSTTVLASFKIATEEGVKGREKYGPDRALARVAMFQTQRGSIATVKEKLQKGDVTAFVALYLDQHREQVLRAWQAEIAAGQSIFDLMSKTTRKLVFENLKGTMTELDLSHCTEIKDQDLGEILKNLPHLRRLILNGCKKLTVKIVKKIEKYNDSLEVLELNDLSWTDIKIKLLNLRRITGQNTSCERITLITPHLEVINFANSKLEDISVQGDRIKKLELRGNKKLKRETIIDLVGQSVELLKHPQNIYLDIPLIATDVIRLCLFYGSSVWTSDNAQLIAQFPQLSLLGNALTHADLNFLISLCSGMQKIDLQGTRINHHALRTIVEKHQALQNITINDFASPQNTKNLPINLEVSTNVFVSTHQGEWLMGGLNGQIEWLDHNLRNKYKLFFGETITAIAILPDGRAVCGFRSAKIKAFDSINKIIMDPENIKPTQELQESNVAGAVVGLKYSARFGRLVNVSQRMIKIWDMNIQHARDLQEKKESKSLKDKQDVYKCILSEYAYDRSSPNITALELLTEKEFVVGYADGSFAIWDLETATLITTFKLRLDKIEMIKKIAPNLVAVVSQANPERVNIVNLTTGCIQNCLQVHQSRINCMQLLTEGGLLATGDETGFVKIWDIQTGKSLCDFTYPEVEIKQLAMVGHNRLAITTTGVLKPNSRTEYDYPVHVVPFVKNDIKLDLINAYQGNVSVERADLKIEMQFERSNDKLLKQWSDLIKTTFGSGEILVGALQTQGLSIQTKNFDQLMSMLEWIKVLARSNPVEFVKQNGMQLLDLATSPMSESSLTASTATSGSSESFTSSNSLSPSNPVSSRINLNGNGIGFYESPFDDIANLDCSQPASPINSFSSLSPGLGSSMVSLPSSPDKQDTSASSTPRISVLVSENGFLARRRSGHVSVSGSWASPQKPSSSMSNDSPLQVNVVVPN